MKKERSDKNPIRLLTVLTCLVLVIALVADILMFGVFAGSLDKAFPGSNLDRDEADAAYQNGLSIAQTIEEEGAVLLENNGTLPLDTETRKINLLGYTSVAPVYGGTGSGGSSYTANRTDFVSALTQAGFEVNPALVTLYNSSADSGENTFTVDFSINELPATQDLASAMGTDFKYTNDCSFEAMQEYSDTAVIVFSRKGGEGNDLPTIMAEYTSYAPDQEKHYLELNSAELSLVDRAKETFGTVIVLINSGNAMEMGFVDGASQGAPGTTGDIDAVLWIGDPGDVGTKGVVNLLTGAVNPSGRTPDIYPYAVETTPSYYNFDTYEYTNSHECFAAFESHPAYLVEYQEGIYDDLRYYSANGSYVLEAGEYTVSLRTDSHHVKDNASYTYTLDQNVVYADQGSAASSRYVGKRSTDLVTAENHFDDVAGDIAYLSRDNWEIVGGSSKEATAEQLEAFRNALVIDESFVDSSDTAPTLGAKNGIVLKDMKGLAYDDAKWSDFLDQLTLQDMYNMLGANGWGSAEAPSIGKPQTYDMDGPSALSYVFDAFMGTCTYETVSYPCQTLLAASWNVDLADAYGEAISKEGEAWDISGWYAPGLNTHRTPFLGRNFEYYSEDGFLAGSMATRIIARAEENGMYCYMKHFALNERETWRHYGLCTWASEQAIRELYFVPFEMAVKEGGSTAVMSSYNNLGTTWAGASHALLTDVLRNEWGFVGTVLTDNNEEHGFMDVEKAVLAGGTSLLYGWGVKTFDTLSKTASGQLKMREAAHQYLYTIANSYATEITSPTPAWRLPAILGSAALYALAAVGIVMIAQRVKKNKALKDA